MDFSGTIPQTAFRQNQLRVISQTPVEVSVIGLEQEVVESFRTDPSQTIYQLQTPLEALTQVKVSRIEGLTYLFFPVYEAL